MFLLLGGHGYCDHIRGLAKGLWHDVAEILSEKEHLVEAVPGVRHQKLVSVAKNRLRHVQNWLRHTSPKQILSYPKKY